MQQMSLRFNRDVLTQLDHVDYVMVMGGNNDVLWRGRHPNQCLEDLESPFLQIQKANAKVIALEILPVTIKWGLFTHKNKRLNYLRETNLGIHALGKKMGIPVVNLYDPLADAKKTGLNRLYDSGDGEHLSVEGYKKVGHVIFTSFLQNLFRFQA